MKVLHLMNRLGWNGGIETYVLNLVPRLSAMGHQQILAYAAGDGSLLERTHHLPCLKSIDPADEREGSEAVKRLLAAESPDVVHVHNVFNLGALDACLSAAPTVVTTHGYQFICPAEDFYQERTREICSRTAGPCCFTVTLRKRCMSLRPRHALISYRRTRWARKNGHRFAGIIAPCAYAADRHVQAGFPLDRVKVLPYFCPVPPLDAPLPPPPRPTITFVGRIREYKGPDHFVRLLGLIPSAGGLMIGDHSTGSAAALSEIATAAGCSDRLKFLPWQSREEIFKIYQNTTVFVFPSIWPETLGIVGLEALAMGIPVTAYNVGGVPEWLEQGRTGLSVEPGDLSALAAATRQIIGSPELRTSMGRAGIELMRAKFSPERHADVLLGIYASGANRHHGRPSAN
jgi:glycosyltransferase involved in cell wall biosynthesis